MAVLLRADIFSVLSLAFLVCTEVRKLVRQTLVDLVIWWKVYCLDGMFGLRFHGFRYTDFLRSWWSGAGGGGGGERNWWGGGAHFFFVRRVHFD